MPQHTAEHVPNPLDSRIIKTPSAVARRTFFYLQECGHLKAGDSHHTSRQNLQSFLFAVVLNGKGTLTYEGQTRPLNAGDCFFIDCRLAHSYQSDAQQPWELLWVHFNGCTTEEYYKLFSAEFPPVFRPVSTLKFISLLQELMRLNSETYADTEILTSGLLAALLTALLTVNSISDENDSALQAKLKTILAHIDANFTTEIRLDELAKRFDISKYYLTREFKRAYGETIFQHIISLRINYAKRLLRFTDKSVEEISSLCGFNDQSYFSKQFKKAENVTCLAFRRRWRD
ncbi:MAG: AraC family transcriptional regulator [Oscillospiraceae bacterium]|nr:AraC family transcriptional regulator [Oscillospiraceae bacterium]